MLHVEEVDDATAEAWREIHNLIIPASPLSAAEVAERRRRNLLTVAYDAADLVGNATVRPPGDRPGVATVIVRILPAFRGRGLGTAYLRAMAERARADGAERLATVVLAANEDGLRFALRHGFVEDGRYEVDGAEYVDLTTA